ncbi:MAG: membrane protein insertase YidC [Planctomycetes bacterium]|nr:membrane protein insertase YidC [Planctomycetota bacterium]
MQLRPPASPHTREDASRRSRLLRRGGFALTVLIMAGFVLEGGARAIPSPDVMVNLFASAAQVLGLVSILLGRWFFLKRGRSAGAAGGRSYRTAFFASLGLCAAASVGWYLYYAAVRDDNLARLQVNLNRNSREEGRKIVDVSLKELSFSDQQQREDGISTDDLARALATQSDELILDVRESEEYEVGAIQRARHARFPDLLAAPESYLDRSRPITLLCFNGNRSSELAAHFESLGYDCRFLIGGYEKWLAEDRPLEEKLGVKRSDLRVIADYPGKDELLDTPDVMRLLETRKVQFVDVRYPGDFEVLGHLPGAVNIPMRKLTTPEVDAAIAALPKDKAIIIPCYDKRSSFFALVMGLRCTRAGYEYLGRYTTPEGFSSPGKDKPHVAAWKAAQAPKSLLTIAAEPLKGSLEWLQGHLGSLALAILALVVAIRVVLLPLTWKSERDRRVQAALAPQLARLRERTRGDGQAYATAASELMKSHGVRPVQNLFATLAQLALFTVFFSVVQQVSTGSREPFLWIEELGAPGAWRSLPIAVGLLIVAQVLMTAQRPYKRWVLGLTVVGAGALSALTWNLSSGVNLYLVLNLVFLVGQTCLFGILERRRGTRDERRAARIVARDSTKSVVPLRHAHLISGCGNKAARLGRLMEAGFDVPDGFVVRASAIAARTDSGQFAGADARAIVEALGRLSATRLAVRSSGLNEDGADKSYAGVFDSILDVDRQSVFNALEQVADSLTSARTAAYSGEHEAGGIVVQAMAPAEFAGVLFTQHPAESGAAAVEMVAGLGDALVSGRAAPRAFRLGRFSGRVLGDAQPPMDLAPLFAVGRRAEALFGKPQDMEWAFAGGRFCVLQARDITRSCDSGTDERAGLQRERARLLEISRRAAPQAVALAQSELSELLPRPTPFSLAFMNELFTFDGPTHRAMAGLGIPYDIGPDSHDYVVSAFGALYVDKTEEARRLARGTSTLVAFRLTRAADEMERAWREDFLPQRLRAARLHEVLDLSRLTLDELVEAFVEARREFREQNYVRAEEINIAADFYMKAALRELKKRGIDAAPELSKIPVTVVHTALERLATAHATDGDTRGFLELFGHRAPLDYEFAEKRYGEDPTLVEALAARSVSARPHTDHALSIPRTGVLGLAIERARRWQALKEEAKHHALRDLAHLRRLVVAIGERTDLGEQVFELTPDEVARLAEDTFRRTLAPELVRLRAEEREAFRAVRLPTQITLALLEELDVENSDVLPRARRKGALHGTRISGTGGVMGRARVLRETEEISAFQKGEILVARFTDPNWMPIFPLAGGIVTEVGGWLSHAAIQAREYGLTGIVGVEGALDSIRTGDLVVLASDGSVEVIEERRTETRVRIERSVRVVRSASTAEGRLRDLSTRGAQLSVSNARLEVGEECTLESAWCASFAARVVRNGRPGEYGLELQARIDPEAVAALTRKE